MSRVSIRHIGIGDIPIVQRLASDPEIAATTLIPHPYPADGAREFITRAIASRERGTDHVFAILADGEFVGVCGLHGIEGDPPRGELGYWIGRPYWGRAYATAAAAQVVHFAFQTLPLTLLTAHCLERNTYSMRILHRLGFREVSRDVNANEKWAADVVVIRFELTRAEYSRA